jgi:hypothetical protein
MTVLEHLALKLFRSANSMPASVKTVPTLPIFAQIAGSASIRTTLKAGFVTPTSYLLDPASWLSIQQEVVKCSVSNSAECVTNPPKPTLAVVHKSLPLSARRGVAPPCMNDLTSFTPRCDHRFAETLFFHKVIEDPDFTLNIELDPSKAAWGSTFIHQDIDIPECSDFFAQEYLAESIEFMFTKEKKLPPPGRLVSMKSAALKKFDEIWKAEVAEAATTETDRVLRCMIEHNVDKVARTERKQKALRKISLQSLIAAGMPKLSYTHEKQIQEIITTEIQKVLKGETLSAFQEQDRFISDLISLYSDDLTLSYWTRPSTLNTVMNDKHRKKITDWIPPPSTTIHNILAHGDPLEELSEDFYATLANFSSKEWTGAIAPRPSHTRDEFYGITWPKAAEGDTMLDWTVFLGEVTGEKEGEMGGKLPEREEGFYSNMSGLSDVSLETSSAGSESEKDAYGDEGDGDEEEESLDTSYSDEIAPMGKHFVDQIPDGFASAREFVVEDKRCKPIGLWAQGLCVVVS